MPYENYVNGYSTTLTSAITNSATTIPVASVVGVPVTGQIHITIENEIIICPGSGISGNSFTGVTRGVESTTAAAHGINTPVNHYLSEGSLRQLVVSHPFKARAHVGAAQTPPANSWTKIALQTIDYDLNNNFSTTNNRYTAPVSGYYLVTAGIEFGSTVNNMHVSIWKNGVEITRMNRTGSGTTQESSASGSDIVFLTANDYIELYTHVGGTTSALDLGSTFCYMAVHLLSI